MASFRGDDRFVRRRWWALAGLFALLAGGVVMANAPGSYIGDNRFEWYWSPGRVLSRVPFLWDSSRGLGRPRGEFGLVTWSVLALLRGLGASPWVAERLWHAALLVTAGTGVVAFLRSFRPSLGLEHLLAGLFYMFNPYSTVFLVPSGLFLNYAIAPWLLVALVKGASSDRPWRWAAILSLLVLASGSTDPPGLFYALLLLIPTAVYLGFVDPRTNWGAIGGWLARAALLSIIVSAATLTQIAYGSGGLAIRLFSTESVEAVHSTTSWAESWRGLGFWASYFSEGNRLLRPAYAAYLESAPVIIATFVPPCIAVATLGWSRWTPRFLMTLLALVGLTLMVGSFPTTNPSPWGRLLVEAYDRFPVLTALRTTYKAGAGLLIGVSCLLGVGTAALAANVARRRGSLRAGPVLATLLLMGIVSYPFWTGQLYSREERMQTLPRYWRSAMAWLDHQPGEARALIVPGTSKTLYRWGGTGDDIFDALLARPHVIEESLPLSTPQAADLVKAIDERIQSNRYEPGMLGPVARRLGIEYVVIRNDVDWQRLRRARPAKLEPLREDEDLELVARFGEAGQNVVAPADRSALAQSELKLPPVEVYRVRDAAGPLRVLPAQPPLLVSGNGDTWPVLAARGLLEGAGPVLYTAAARHPELARSVAEGSQVVVTDTNRRRGTFVTRLGETESHTLATGEDLRGRTSDLFKRAGSQTVAAFTDARRITSTSTGSSISGFEPWFRPANAFDGDEGTWWLTEGIQDPIGGSVRVELERPVEVSTVDVLAAQPPTVGRTVSAATVLFSDGSEVPVDLSTGRAHVTVAPRRTTSLEVRIDGVMGPGLGAVGFSEIRVPSLDLLEVVQVPDDLFRAADRDSSLRDKLATAPLTYVFERMQEGDRDVEASMRRRFRSVAQRSYALDGRLAVGRATSDETVDAMIGAPVGAYGTERYLGELENRGGLAVDGRMETGWVAPARRGERLTIRFPRRRVDRVDLTSVLGANRSALSGVRVTVGATVFDVELRPSPDCVLDTAIGSETRCANRGAVTFPPVVTDRVIVEVTDVKARSTNVYGDSPIEVSEVMVGPEPLAAAGGGARHDGCLEGIVALDGEQVPVRVRGSVDDLLASRPVPYRGCEPFSLGSGWHRLDTGPWITVESAILATGSPPADAAAAVTKPSLDVVSRDPARLRVHLHGPAGGAILINGQSYDPRWRARMDDRDLGPPQALDTQNGWLIPDQGNHMVDVRYRPQRIYQIALGLTLSGMVACAGLAVRRRRA